MTFVLGYFCRILCDIWAFCALSFVILVLVCDFFARFVSSGFAYFLLLSFGLRCCCFASFLSLPVCHCLIWRTLSCSFNCQSAITRMLSDYCNHLSACNQVMSTFFLVHSLHHIGEHKIADVHFMTCYITK